jgi:hypothetical protein
LAFLVVGRFRWFLGFVGTAFRVGFFGFGL